MKKKLLSAMLIFSFSLFAEPVNWYSSYNEALDAAKKEEKNIFVLITAPSWCYWCQELEKNVLSLSRFQDYLSENYIPLMLLDEVDGYSNPELDNFSFSGFPTVFLYDSEGSELGNFYSQDPDQMLGDMAKYKDITLSKIQLPIKYTYSGGEYVNGNDGTWIHKTGQGSFVLSQRDFDLSYLYLVNDEDGSIIALPMDGSDAHLGQNGADGFAWSDLPEVTQVGGDL